MPALHVFTQREVDQFLIVSTPGRVNLLPEPIKHVVIEPNGNASLPGWSRVDGSSPTLPEVILLFHGLPLILLAFTSGRLSRRDDPNVFSSPCIHNHQNSPKGIGTNSDEAFLCRRVIFDGDSQVVEEKGDAVSEVDAVLAEVRSSLLRVPFEFLIRQLYVQMYTTSRQETV